MLESHGTYFLYRIRTDRLSNDMIFWVQHYGPVAGAAGAAFEYTLHIEKTNGYGATFSAPCVSMLEEVGGNLLRLPWDTLQRMFPGMTPQDKTALALEYRLCIDRLK